MSMSSPTGGMTRTIVQVIWFYLRRGQRAVLKFGRARGARATKKDGWLVHQPVVGCNNRSRRKEPTKEEGMMGVGSSPRVSAEKIYSTYTTFQRLRFFLPMIAGHRNRGGFYCIAAMRRHRNRNLLFLCDVLVNTQFCKQTHGLVYAALSVSPLLSRYTAGSGGLALASLMYCVYCIIFRCSFDLDPRKSKLEPISPYFFFVLPKKKEISVTFCFKTQNTSFLGSPTCYYTEGTMF